MANTPTPKQDKSKNVPARTKRGVTTKVVPLSVVVQSIASKTGRDATKTGKLVRSYIRSNFDDVAKRWPTLRDAQKVNRDGNRYPPMPSALATELITRFTSKSGK